MKRPLPASLGVAAAVAATVSWATSGLLGKSIHAPLFVMLTWRQVIAVSALGALLWLTGDRHRPRAAHLRVSAIAAVLLPLHMCLFFVSIQLTSVAIVVLIFALSPVLILPLAAWWFDERAAPHVWALAVVALVGIALVVGTGEAHGTRPALGLGLAIVNLFVWVAYTFASKHARSRGVPTMTWLLVANVGALVASVGGLAIAGNSPTAVAASDWLRIAALALVPGLLGHGLMIWAYRSIDVSLASVIALGEPVLGAAGAALLLGESLGAVQVTGILAVCVAVGVVVALDGRDPTRRLAPPR